MSMETRYSAKDITVLEGLEPVRKRPSMYIGGTDVKGLHHMVWEIVDNSIDEAMAGHATRIDVTIHEDGLLEVQDDGRGVPVGKHKTGKDALEVVHTVLHAGGKFSDHNYVTAGGLHGVGASVVNALSTSLKVEVDRNGDHHVLQFLDGGKPQGKLKVTGSAPRGRTGTTVTFYPDPTIFEEIDFRAKTVTERLQIMAFLNKGLEIRFTDERKGREQKETFKYNGLTTPNDIAEVSPAKLREIFGADSALYMTVTRYGTT